MILSLNITNYALIDSLSIDFDRGFSVITGETGAGKSIIMGALAMILGQRADARSVKEGENKCIVEATFDVSNYALEPFFVENDLEYDAEHCIVRREVLATGKSRAFVNDSPVSLAILKQLGASLIDIHSQHQNLLLGEDRFQLRVVDTLARNEEILTAYRSEYSRYKQLTTELRLLTEKAAKSKEEADYLRFQLEQLDEANLVDGEQEKLEEELQELNHAEDIKMTLYNITQLLDSNEGEGVLSMLRDAAQRASSLTRLYPKVEETAERLHSDYIDLKDILDDVERMLDNVNYDPERMEWISDRLDTIYRLEQKHHVATDTELIAFRNQIAERLDGIDSSDERIADLRRELERQQKRLADVAHLLTGKRKEAAKGFVEGLVAGVKPLGMPNVRFDVQFTPKLQVDETGADNVAFLFSANKNKQLMPVADIASGGEISRLMLVIKSLIAGATALPTIVFDEIDTGVSGEIADKMAGIMVSMARYMQVLTITHLPQVAGKGDAHYKVYKVDDEHQTTTHIVRLSADERVDELARMLSGAAVTEQARSNARVLLERK
jgi:DNA repair protein RecN (Recombination protein N)